MSHYKIKIRFIYLLLFLFLSPELKAKLSKEPLLRLNTKMHTATISNVDADLNAKTAISCSYDKTLKVWDLKNKRLKATLRVPVLKGNEGKLYACAISPDGRYAAAGGWTAWGFSGKASIYIFDLKLKKIVLKPSKGFTRLSKEGIRLS